jgi:hypothetical protein
MGLATLKSKEDAGAFWRRLILPEEDRTLGWDGRGYRWFRSENVVCLEHFRKPRKPGQKAGRFGWVQAS